MEYDNTNSGVFFRERDKQGNEKRPDYTGKLNVEGKEYRLAGWIRQGAKGDFLSLKVSEPQPPKSRSSQDFDDDIPF